jgi:hypothetical protein
VGIVGAIAFAAHELFVVGRVLLGGLLPPQIEQRLERLANGLRLLVFGGEDDTPAGLGKAGGVRVDAVMGFLAVSTVFELV